MVERAIAELQLDLKQSYVVGDHIRDVQLARNVGAKAVLLASGQVDAQARLKAEQAEPNVVVASMTEAAEWILADVATSTVSATHPHRQPDVISGSSVDR